MFLKSSFFLSGRALPLPLLVVGPLRKKKKFAASPRKKEKKKIWILNKNLWWAQMYFLLIELINYNKKLIHKIEGRIY